MAKKFRTLQRVINARPTSDGDGVKITRIAGRDINTQLDPFLLLDEIRSDDSKDYVGGFPPHPHRGFETVTYMLQGKMRHKDHLGNEGLITDGGLQWMTAGRGIIHSEMPEQTEGLLHGFQLWLNLPAAEKMKAADYWDIAVADIPVIQLAGNGVVRVLAGEVRHDNEIITGPAPVTSTQPVYLDISLPANEQWVFQGNAQQTMLLHIFSGSSNELKAQQMGVYADGNSLRIIAGSEGLRGLVLAANPLQEPIEQYGPFVMNTPEQIQQAINDYNKGCLTG